MNNADSTATVVVYVEIFDPASGTVLHSGDYTTDVAPRGSSTISTTVDAPADAIMLRIPCEGIHRTLCRR